MRHLNKGRKLQRTASHRKSLLSNLATSLFKSGDKKIKTTLAKAKEARILVEKLITKAKRASSIAENRIAVVSAKREIYKIIRDRSIITSIFTDVVPKIANRPGGYSRVVKIGQRLGDGAQMAILELVDFNIAQDKTAAASAAKEKKSILRRKKKDDIEDAKVVAKSIPKKKTYAKAKKDSDK